MIKSYKRESAWVLMIVLMALTVYGMWNPQAVAAAEMLVAPVFLFFGTAFALDAYAKQIK